ncbi:MAG: glycerol-3-phosphate dehydrogenase C-terminal domain-containing protein, partial [Bacillota bacterium]|nr:glycerol-3-phosphate dehydrogenase C-terminal domain-containing protein [Bacillota bacterium]
LIHEQGKDPSEISRKDEIWTSVSGLITIAGGKLTGYRKMAEIVVDLLANQLVNNTIVFKECRTKQLPISGGHVGGSENFTAFIRTHITEGIKASLKENDAKELATMYGSNAPILFEISANRRHEAEQYNLPLTLFAKLVYGIEHEMVATPVDFFCRRTGDLLFNFELVKKYKEEVIQYMTVRLMWTEKQTQGYRKELENFMIDAIIPSDDPNRSMEIEKLSW